MAKLSRVSWIVATLFLIACAMQFVSAAEPPADQCALPAATVSKILGETFISPEKTVAPRPFPNTNSGADCTYQSKNRRLLFRVYVDPSPSAATDLFARLKSFFGPGSISVAGLGDEAYSDAGHGLHVRKGKVRFFLSGSATDKQLKDLATGVVGQL